MEDKMGVVLTPGVMMIPAHLHPAYVRRQQASYAHQRHLLLQQQQKILRESVSNCMPGRFTWTFPGYNILKMNTDGSSKGNPGPASFGGLIRDGHGRWLCGYVGKMKGKKAYTSLEAEVWSIYKGLCLIKEKKLSNLLIETDCQAVLLLGLRQVNADHPLGAVLDAIYMIMMEHNCTMIHTRRDGNHSADQLAKLGGRQSDEYTVLDEPPAVLLPYLLRDMQAASEFKNNQRSEPVFRIPIRPSSLRSKQINHICKLPF